MIAYLKYIGLFDKDGKVHGVKLAKGLNLITGKSSTGKSSLIEIFDFCMGSSEDTIPHGIIEENADIFFLWINIKNKDYLLGRDAGGSNCYLVTAPGINEIEELSNTLFDDYDLSQEDYKIKLGILFGIDAQNTAETIEQFNDKRKNAGRPTVRNMMPFILQHQNLVANKQALFYRFDQKEKRDATINQFKVFSGFVDAKYYSLSLYISILSEKMEVLSRKLARADEEIKELFERLLEDLEVYRQITGNELLDDLTLEQFKDNPGQYKKIIDEIDFFGIEINTENNPQLKKYQELEKEENSVMADLREAQLHLEEVENSIDYIDTYRKSLEQTPRPTTVTLNYSVCPFCHQHTSNTVSEANTLRKALDTLNEELKGIPSIVRPMHEEKIRIIEKIEDLKSQLARIDVSKAEQKEIIEELRKNYSLNKQAYKTLSKISSRIELASNEAIVALQREKEELEEELYWKQQDLKTYDLNGKYILAERAIRQSMAQYRKMIPFETSLDEYSLVFDLKKFELYFIRGNSEDKKYLRSIGSGANWLNAHLCLFLALADFFYRQKKSTIPSLLFLDQPSQVYFPAVKDNYDVFSPEENSATNVDEDMAAVNNIFSMLYKYSRQHGDNIQIIVTDHADNLKIDGLENFEDIVRARWRKEGEGLVKL